MVTVTVVCVGQSSAGVKMSVLPLQEKSPRIAGSRYRLLSVSEVFMGVRKATETGLRRETSVAAQSGENPMTIGARKGRSTSCHPWGTKARRGSRRMMSTSVKLRKIATKAMKSVNETIRRRIFLLKPAYLSTKST
jgi:hypothetical protein